MALIHAPMLKKPSPWHLRINLFTKQRAFNVSRISDLKSFDIHYTSFPRVPYELLSSIKNILDAIVFSIYFHFHHAPFS